MNNFMERNSSCSKEMYLTFDMDWANDGVLDYFYKMICELQIDITLFVTHQTKWLDKFREDEHIELGIHPNFNFLLEGEANSRNKNAVIEEINVIVPEASAVRSHSLVKSTALTYEFAKAGMKYELNYYIPPQNGLRVMPWEFQNILQVPFMFEDDLYLMERKKRCIDFYLSDYYDMVKVFNFHPIHLYLNSENLERYQNAKVFYHDFEKLKAFRNTESEGIENFFRQLIMRGRENNFQFKKISDISWT